jgi:hypothetical protein
MVSPINGLEDAWGHDPTAVKYARLNLLPVVRGEEGMTRAKKNRRWGLLPTHSWEVGHGI